MDWDWIDVAVACCIGVLAALSVVYLLNKACRQFPAASIAPTTCEQYEEWSRQLAVLMSPCTIDAEGSIKVESQDSSMIVEDVLKQYYLCFYPGDFSGASHYLSALKVGTRGLPTVAAVVFQVSPCIDSALVDKKLAALS